MFSSLFSPSARRPDAAGPGAPAFAAFADLLPHPAWTAAPDGAFTAVNARWADLAGRPEDALGEGWTALVPEARRAAVRAAYRAAVDAAAPFDLDVPLDLPAGRRACRLLGRPHHADGVVQAWIGALFVGTAAPEVPAAPAAAPDAGDRPRVLVVEDNPDTQYLLRRILSRGHAVTTASDLASALALARREAFDLLLIDIHLNDGTSGVTLLETLRGLPGYADVPAAAVTAYGLPNDQDRFLDAGFDRYLAKPFTASDLLRLVGELLGKA